MRLALPAPSAFLLKKSIRLKQKLVKKIYDSLEPGGSLGGTAQLNGQPLIAGFVYVKGTPFSTVSNETGTYRLSPLPFGSYQLSVRPNSESQIDDFELQETIDISSYSPENTRDIVIDP